MSELSLGVRMASSINIHPTDTCNQYYILSPCIEIVIAFLQSLNLIVSCVEYVLSTIMIDPTSTTCDAACTLDPVTVFSALARLLNDC